MANTTTKKKTSAKPKTATKKTTKPKTVAKKKPAVKNVVKETVSNQQKYFELGSFVKLLFVSMIVLLMVLCIILGMML